MHFAQIYCIYCNSLQFLKAGKEIGVLALINLTICSYYWPKTYSFNIYFLAGINNPLPTHEKSVTQLCSLSFQPSFVNVLHYIECQGQSTSILPPINTSPRRLLLEATLLLTPFSPKPSSTSPSAMLDNIDQIKDNTVDTAVRWAQLTTSTYCISYFQLGGPPVRDTVGDCVYHLGIIGNNVRQSGGEEGAGVASLTIPIFSRMESLSSCRLLLFCWKKRTEDEFNYALLPAEEQAHYRSLTEYSRKKNSLAQEKL